MTKLPAGRLARHAYLDTIGNAGGLVRVGGAWLLLSWATLLLARAGGPLGALANLAVAVGVAAVAVAWHRHILLGEPLDGRMAPLNARVARYFALTVLLAIAMSAPPLLALAAAGGAAPGEGGGASLGGGALVAVPAVVLAALYAALRLQLVFPATAIGDAGMGFARSWAATRGNGWRLLVGFLAVTLPAAAAAIALVLALHWAAAATGSVALLALGDLAAAANAWIQTPLIASFLSYAYLWFQQRERQVVPA